MATLYIARHGNTFDEGDLVRRIGRRSDLPLSQSGRAQAQALAAYFAKAEIRFSRILSSPLKRTFETAAAIAALQPDHPQIEAERALVEIDYGPDENQPEEKVRTRIGEAALSRWETLSTPPPGWQVDPDELRNAWRKLFARVAAVGSGACALAVTSNGVARFALDAATRVQGEFPKKMRTGAFGRIEIAGADAVVAAWDQRP